MWKTIQDPVLHIELRRWADILVIAPLDCNTLAKISNGICDNLLVSYNSMYSKRTKNITKKRKYMYPVSWIYTCKYDITCISIVVTYIHVLSINR